MHSSSPKQEWFDRPDNQTGTPGLRFNCTMCGNCCSGSEGYVLLNDNELSALAKRHNISPADFRKDFMTNTPEGPSLKEKPGPNGSLDCILLDRTTIPGKAVCGAYEDRPTQCRTWPFWDTNLESPQAWRKASELCPGMNKGDLFPPEHIRIQRAKSST